MANWLRELFVEFSQPIVVNGAKATSVTANEESLDFLIELTERVESSENDEQIYQFFVSNQTHLNEQLLQTLLTMVPQWLNQKDEHLIGLANLLFQFGGLLQQFPFGNRALNLELAITSYQLALQVYTREAFPQDWAMTQNNLAIAYWNRIRGERADNIEQAITSYQLALQVYTREAFPQDWAMTQNNLANAYRNRIRGERADNIEQAIASFQLVLQVYTREAFPENWATTQNNLAIAYRNRIRGERADNIEQAITSYQLALQVYTREAFPENWATTQNNLAIAYRNRIRGERADNIEQAIASFQLVLQVYTREAFPEDWAMTQNNLAIAYRNRIRGERADNIEQAIASFQLVLQVYTREAFPQDWAMTQNNLANVYWNRLRGDRADNIEQAIASYQLALQVRTREAFPEDWAMTQNNLANAYIDRLRGDRADNIEQAIASYQLALQVRTREAFSEKWAMTQNNLATAYIDRLRGDRADNIEQAIASYQLALQVRTREAFPEDWAMTQNNLANAYRSRLRGDRADNIEQAIASYQLALQVRTREAFPKNCFQTARNLGNIYSQDQQAWGKAASAYMLALEAGEILYQSAILLDGKTAELAQTNDLPHRAAYALARSGKLQDAALRLEQGRARGLSETLERDRANLTQLQNNRKDLYNQYEDITTQLRNLETQERLWLTSEDHHNLTPADLSTTALSLHQKLTSTISQIRQVPGYEEFLAQPDFNDIVSVIQPRVPLVYLSTTSFGSFVLIIHKSAAVASLKVTSVWLDKFTVADLGNLLSKWHDTYKRHIEAQNRERQVAQQKWFDVIDRVTQDLWTGVMTQIVQSLQEMGVEQAVLIPTGLLGFLPLHAAWTENPDSSTGRRYALDDITFTYAPNARCLQSAYAIANHTQLLSLLAVNQPRPVKGSELPSVEAEVRTAIAAFPSSRDLKELKYEQATLSNISAALKAEYSLLHFACHGRVNFTKPLESGLLMANDELLTLRELLNLRMKGVRLAVLSACETGIPGEELPDEVVSLPSGLLQAGVAGIVASLWSVDDLATALLLVRFYDLWRGKEKLEPYQALHQAQQWVRDTTNGEKKEYFKKLKKSKSTEVIPPSAARFLWGKLIDNPRYHDEAGLGFAAPYYWAAFNYVGV